MKPIVLCPMLAVMLSACAHDAAKEPPVCDGHHLRSANPYGSVLAPQASPGAAPPATAGDKANGPELKAGAPQGGCGR